MASALRTPARRLLRTLGAGLPLELLIRLSGQPGILPVYHLSTDHPAPHIAPLYPVRPLRLFRQDLETLLRTYRPVDLDALSAHLSGDRPLREPWFHLSFDDGLRQIAEEVAPVLLEYGVPATFFLNPAFIGNQRLFFRFKAALLAARLREMPRQDAGLTAWLAQESGLRPAGASAMLLRLRWHQEPLLDEAARRLEVDFGAFLRSYRPYLDAGQVHSLLGQGFAIGSHSIDHPEYQYLPLEEQLRQTLEGQAALEAQFPLRHRVFAFPFTDDGVQSAWFAELSASGQPFGLTFGCAGLKPDPAPRHLQRIPMEKSLAPAVQILREEYLYYVLKLSLGRHRIRRA
ncbi:MAG: polysaccharide deacetylase family protein [Bacteroidia bacterium]|nr:polysaccharide deacetylase family protein [Bacteroidia bacterium]